MASFYWLRHLFIYLDLVFDKVLHPQGICRPRKEGSQLLPTRRALTNKQKENKGNPSPSAVRCAQDPGYEPPLT